MQQTLLLGRVLQMNDTTNVEAAVNLADLANDGLLGGSLVESDSEILLLPGLSRRDRVQFGSTEDMTAWERMESTGLTLGQTPETEKVPIVDRKSSEPPESLTVDNRYFLRMWKPDHLDCLNFKPNWKLAFYPDGQQQVRHFECGKCVNCVEWRKVEIAHQYALVRGDWQTVATVGGFSDPDAANKWADAQGNRVDGQRHRMMRWDDVGQSWQLVITYNRTLDGHTIELTERDIERKHLVGRVEVRSLSPLEFKAMLPDAATHAGPSGKRRRASHFTDWPGYEKTPDTYATSDPTYYINDNNPPEPTEMISLEKERALLPVETQADLWAADWWADTDPINAGTFDDALLRADELEPEHETVKAIREQSRYGGPTALLVDAIRYQADAANVPYREAYRHVLQAAGRPAPAPQCAGSGCDARTPLTELGLCIVCDLERGA